VNGQKEKDMKRLSGKGALREKLQARKRGKKNGSASRKESPGLGKKSHDLNMLEKGQTPKREREGIRMKPRSSAILNLEEKRAPRESLRHPE